VTQKKPATRKDISQLLLVNLRIVEDPPADLPVIGVDESADVGDHGLSPWSMSARRRGIMRETRQNRFQPTLSG
jgi:hypothetical protein